MKIFALLLCAVVSGQHWSYGWHPGKNPIDAKYHTFFHFKANEALLHLLTRLTIRGVCMYAARCRLHSGFS